MRWPVFLLVLAAASDASAQYVVPLATADGQVACTQGMTGLGRPPGGWRAVRDPEAPGGWALTETTGDATDLRFPFCISTETVARDFDATLRFKIVGGGREQAAGLMFRALDATDYLVVRASALDRMARLYRLQGGRRSQLASREADVVPGKWHALRVLAVVDRLEVWLDGQSLFSFVDRNSVRSGAIGIWSQSDSVALFGSLLVGRPP